MSTWSTSPGSITVPSSAGPGAVGVAACFPTSKLPPPFRWTRISGWNQVVAPKRAYSSNKNRRMSPTVVLPGLITAFESAFFASWSVILTSRV